MQIKHDALGIQIYAGEKVPLKSYVTLLVNFALIEIIFKTVQHAKYML